MLELTLALPRSNISQHCIKKEEIVDFLGKKKKRYQRLAIYTRKICYTYCIIHLIFKNNNLKPREISTIHLIPSAPRARINIRGLSYFRRYGVAPASS